MELNEINKRTKEIFTLFDQIRDNKNKIRRASVGEDNVIDDDKFNWTELGELYDKEEKLQYELFRTLKEDAEKQGFMPVDFGPYWKIPNDIEELQDLIDHKKMLIEKYPDDMNEKIALTGLEARKQDLLKNGCEN